MGIDAAIDYDEINHFRPADCQDCHRGWSLEGHFKCVTHGILLCPVHLLFHLMEPRPQPVTPCSVYYGRFTK
jgi:hypothetical protein